LKDAYNPEENNIPCEYCVAYNAEGEHYLYSLASASSAGSGGQMEYMKWSHEGGIWMPKDKAALICRVSLGNDQPEKYNINSEPLKKDLSYMCCNECVRTEGKLTPATLMATDVPLAGCKSWVFKSKARECYLKNEYNPDENNIPCDECISYDASSFSYVFQKESKVLVQDVQYTKDSSQWSQSTFGAGGSWSTAATSTTGPGVESCTFSVGKDQSNQYNMMEPYIFPAAYQCCSMCAETEGRSPRRRHVSYSVSRLRVLGMEREHLRVLPQE